MNKKLYFDNAATTKVRKEVADEMYRFLEENYGNPSSSVYELGRTSKAAIDSARKNVANFLNAEETEVFFTGSGTESDNWAIIGTAFANLNKKKHIITTKIEHHAVLHTCEYLEKFGIETTYLNVDKYGMIDLEELKSAIRPDTMLISVMYANNEIGTIQPIKEIGAIAREKGILFHTDAVQAFGAVKIDVKEENIDLLSISAHKINGPKGIGALYIRKGVKIDNFVHGGAQEKRKRAGTESVHNIVGFGKAVELLITEFEQKTQKQKALRDRLIKGLHENLDEIHLNGHPTERLPNNVNISFKYIEGEGILLWLDMDGIAASSGSACTSGSLDPSHVLLATGLDHGDAHGSIRLTVSAETTEEEVDFVIKQLTETVEKLRKMSPLYNKK